MRVKVHRVVLMVVDHDDLGSDQVRREIENVQYPNRCLSPVVMQTETEKIEWSDGNNLNRSRTRFGAFCELFKRSPSDA